MMNEACISNGLFCVSKTNHTACYFPGYKYKYIYRYTVECKGDTKGPATIKFTITVPETTKIKNAHSRGNCELENGTEIVEMDDNYIVANGYNHGGDPTIDTWGMTVGFLLYSETELVAENILSVISAPGTIVSGYPVYTLNLEGVRE